MFEVALIGNPNAGKTTIFNYLTGKNERTGNYHGVTVNEKKALLKGENLTVVDLPGIYSFNAYSIEEKVSKSYIESHPNSLYVCVIESSNFLSSLSLFNQLSNRKLKVLLVLNMYDEFIKNGGYLDLKGIEKQLNITVLTIDATSNKDLKKLKKAIDEKRFSVANFGDENLLKKLIVLPIKKEGVFDRVLLSKILSPIISFLIIFSVFFITFSKYGLGDFLLSLCESGVSFLSQKIEGFLSLSACPIALKSFLIDGVINSLGSVVCFLPQLTILYFFLTVLDETGVTARLAYMLDGVFKKIGLNGRAVFSLTAGFGCTALAVLSTKGLDDKPTQKKLALSLPFVSCLAKLPVYTLIINKCFLRAKPLLLTAIYLGGLILSFIVSGIISKFFIKTESSFVMEIPPLRTIKLKKVLKVLICYLKEFIIRIGSVIFVVLSVLYLLANFDFTLKYLGKTGLENSILAFFGKKLSFIFYPIGVTDWRLTVSVLSGVFAKESIASTLTYLCGNTLPLSGVSAVSFLTFIAFYTPCISALTVIKGELGFVLTLALAIGQFLFALLLSYLVGLIARLSLILSVWYIAFALIICLLALLKIVMQKEEKTTCVGCNNAKICGKRTK